MAGFDAAAYLAGLRADPERAAEWEAEWADNWDSADSAAYQTRAEAGLEPEAETNPDLPVPYWPACPPIPYRLTPLAEAVLDEAAPYPAFDDDPARWGLRPGAPMTGAELAAAAEAGAWGPAGPCASYAEWAAETGDPEPGP
jgi:hypothetical protein